MRNQIKVLMAMFLFGLQFFVEAQFSGNYVIQNAASGKAISVYNSYTANSTKVHLWDYVANPDQIWAFTVDVNGKYTIIGQRSLRALDVASGSTADGATIQIYDSNGTNAQKWEVVDLGNSTYKIINVGSGKAISVDNNGTSNGSNINQWTYSGSSGQIWKIVSTDQVSDLQGPITTHKNLNQPHTEPLIPKWALGYMQSQWGGGYGYDTQTGFLNHAKALRGISNPYGDHTHPADVMVLDMYWCGGTDASWNWPTNMLWDYNKYPNPKAMIDELHSMNYRLAMNYHASGFGSEWLAKMKDHLNMGLDIVWLDFWTANSVEESQIWDLLGQVWGDNRRKMFFARHYARPNKFNHESNPYGQLGQDKNPDEAAIQKTMPMHWTGDVDGSWSGFQETIEGIVYGIDGAMDGWSYLHADCPGHIGGSDPELANRWIQFSDFSPFTRNHGATSSRDVWAWGQHVEDNSKFSRSLRYRLLPYIYTTCWQVWDKAMPITRPLRLVYPGQRDDIRYEYMFGDNLLVAPVYKARTSFTNEKMDVYLPSGEEWVDYWTHQTFTGGQSVKYDVSVVNDKYIPLFVKRGSIIPMGPQIYWIDTKIHPDPITLDIYPLKDGVSSFRMYDDDGETNNYKSNKYATTDFSCNQSTSGIKVDVSATIGTYSGKPSVQNYILKINLIEKKYNHITKNGANIPAIVNYQDLLGTNAPNEGWAIDKVNHILYVRFQTAVDMANTIFIEEAIVSSIDYINPVAQLFNVEVYPNPANRDIVTIKCNFDCEGAVLELIQVSTGSSLIKTRIENSATALNLSSVTNGIYLVRVKGNGHEISKKLVIQKLQLGSSNI